MKVNKLMHWRKGLVIPTILCGIGLLVVATTVHVGATGGLDGTFGTGGKVITHFTNSDDSGYAIALQTDGKIVVAGNAGGTDFAVARYNVNGSPDMTFDGDGMVVTDIAGLSDYCYAIAIQSDGKIVVAGETTVGQSSDFAIVRYNADGSLDTSFDTDGKVTTDLFGNGDGARGVAIQDDGRIVVAGSTVTSTAYDFGVARYNTNGALDSTFGSGGKFSANILGTTLPGSDQGNAVAIQGDGKIVVVGSSWYDPFLQFAMIRCNANGSLDSSFGTGGLVTTLFGGGWGGANAVAIQNDGKILVAGNGNLPARFGVVRYNTNGSLDGTFGSGGIVTTEFGSGSSAGANSVVVQNNGKIVVGGTGSNGTNGSDFAMARYNGDGSLDSKSVTPIGSLADYCYGIALQSDGRIVAAGRSQVTGVGYEFAVARYDGGPLISAPRRFDFNGDGKSDLGVIRPTTGFWYIAESGTGNITELQYNLPNDKMVPADYDGDGKTEIANFRDGNWRVRNGGGDVHFGQTGDVPVPGDYDGDAKADFAVFRAGTWYVNQSRDGATGFGFGISTDKPVPEDYDGDGKYDAAVYRDGAWYIRNSTGGVTGVQFGLSTDRPVPADYDGDYKADVAVYRDGIWYILGSSTGFRAVNFGLSTDVPVPADYDGDSKADIAVFRNGTWYVLRSSNGVFEFFFWGTTGDVPLESVYLH